MDTDSKDDKTAHTAAPKTIGTPEAALDAPTALADEALDRVAGGNQVARNPKSPFDTPLGD